MKATAFRSALRPLREPALCVRLAKERYERVLRPFHHALTQVAKSDVLLPLQQHSTPPGLRAMGAKEIPDDVQVLRCRIYQPLLHDLPL